MKISCAPSKNSFFERVWASIVSTICIVAFNRNDIFTIKRKVESTTTTNVPSFMEKSRHKPVPTKQGDSMPLIPDTMYLSPAMQYQWDSTSTSNGSFLNPYSSTEKNHLFESLGNQTNQRARHTSQFPLLKWRSFLPWPSRSWLHSRMSLLWNIAASKGRPRANRGPNCFVCRSYSRLQF